MVNYLVKEESLISIADAIREKTGETAELSFPEDYIIKINDLANASDEIPSNGKDWVQSNISNGTFNDVHSNGELWVACSMNGLYYSEDGKTWSQTNMNEDYFYRVNYANNTWVASGSQGLYYSTDGINWNLSDYYGDTVASPDIEYHNGYWGYFNYDMQEFYNSPDGISWETTGIIIPNNVYYNEDLGSWVAFEAYSPWRINIYTSSIGAVWTSEGSSTNAVLPELNNFYCANGLTLASWGSESLFYSTDGMNFTEYAFPTATAINKFFYANGLWMALTGNDKGIYYSTDGTTWTHSAMNIGSFTSIYYENFMWVAGSTEGIYYSIDGITWTQSTGITSSVEDVYCDSSIWVAATDNTGLYYSESAPVTDADTPNSTCEITIGNSTGFDINVYYYDSSVTEIKNVVFLADTTIIVDMNSMFVIESSDFASGLAYGYIVSGDLLALQTTNSYIVYAKGNGNIQIMLEGDNI